MQAECGFHNQTDGCFELVKNGPTIQVIITFDPSMHPSQQTINEGSFQNIPSITMPALVDTGALESYIDTSIATALQLPIVDRQMVSGSVGAHHTDVYLAQIIVPSLKMPILGRFAGVKLIEGGQQFGALLGRTFLCHLHMEYNGITGQVTLTNPKT